MVPDAEVTGDDGNVRERVTEITIEGYHGTVNMKRYLSVRVLWPGLDKMVERKSASGDTCHTSTVQQERDPLQPYTAL